MNKWKTKSGIQVIQILGGRSNSYLISSEGKFILVDTRTKGSWGKLSSRLGQLIPEKGALIALVLTHVHYDHCENSAKIRDVYGTKVVVHESEATFLTSGKNSITGGALSITNLFYTLVNGKRLLSLLNYSPSMPDTVVHEEHAMAGFDDKAYLLHTPGHSVGSMSIIIDNEIAIVGDAMFGVFKNSVFPPWANDTKMMIKSWKKLLDTGCNVFLPGHGTANSRELVQKQYNKYKGD